MKSYINTVKNVLRNGVRQVNRTGIDTFALPNVHFSHDMSKGFPLLTTKRVAFKTMSVELEGFIKGVTSKKWYQDRGCKIWNEWANPVAVEEFYRINYTEPYERQKRADEEAGILNIDDYCPPRLDVIRKLIQQSVDDLGTIYGSQWRSFNKCYDEDDGGWVEGYEKEADQLQQIVDRLHTNPNDRRMVCSAWNPLQISRMALPPCHFAWCLTVIGDTISLHWDQRSCDLMLGVPFNIASYALLLELLVMEANQGGYAKEHNIKYKAGNLSGMLCNCHIYENQIEAAEEQIGREPRDLPQLRITGVDFDIFKWTHQDLQLVNYNPHKKIDFGAVAV